MQQFVAVAEEGSFHRAAERLFMTQPPLSMAIRKIEEDLGCLLLQRKPKKFALTPAGELFLKESRKLLDQAEALSRRVREVADGTSGHLQISFVGSALYGKLPELIRLYRKTYTGVRLDLRMGTSEQQFEMLRKNETDVAVLHEPPGIAGDFAGIVFDRDRLCMALPVAHPLAVDKVKLADLKDEPFIIWPRAQGRVFFDKAIELCARAGFSPDIVQEAHQMQAVLSLVAVEAGVAVVPQSMSDFRNKEIVYFSIPDPKAAFNLILLSRKQVENAAVRQFVQMAEDSEPAGQEAWVRAEA